jgi:ABC-2 type transport system ATP-binding protein
MTAAIQVKSLSATREGVHILKNLSLSVPEGRVVGLLGPSGAGKTTLMQTIVGLMRPTEGKVEVFGLKAGSKKLRSQIGYVTQSPSVYSDLSVEENLRYFATMEGADRGRIEQVLKDVSLTDHAGQVVASLSGGQRARVSLAVALLGRPRLLVLDEPTVGLDPVLRMDLWHQFHTLAKEGTTLLVSSHVMDEANRCDNLILLRDGQLLAADTPKALMSSTRTSDIESAFLKLVEHKS